MAEATEPCLTCGKPVDAGYTACPYCGAEVPMRTGLLASIVASFSTHKWFWIGGTPVVVAALAAALYFGGLFGPNGQAICEATLTQAKDFGVLSPSAVLASHDAKSTDVKGRKSCTASVGEDSYTLQVDVKNEDASHKPCRDLKKQNSCVALYSVARSDGLTTYQVREIPPDETDEAILAAEGQANAAAPAGGVPAGEAGAPSAESGMDDTETAVDTAPSAPAQPAAQPQ